MTTIEVSRPLATAPLTPAFATATAGEIELLAYFLKEKAKAIAWVEEDPANRFSCAAVCEYSIEYIRERGWNNLNEYLLEQARITYCDFHKEVHGVKARWAWELTLEECEAGIARLEREWQQQLEWEREQEQERLAEEALEAELLKGAPDLRDIPDLHEVFAERFRLGA